MKLGKLGDHGQARSKEFWQEDEQSTWSVHGGAEEPNQPEQMGMRRN